MLKVCECSEVLTWVLAGEISILEAMEYETAGICKVYWGLCIKASDEAHIIDNCHQSKIYWEPVMIVPS